MAERRYDVVGIGNAIVDIIARADDAFLSKHDLAKGFMRLVDADGAPLDLRVASFDHFASP